MCGILFSKIKKIKKVSFNSALELMDHRGPDATGYFTQNSIQISTKLGYDLILSGHDTLLKLNLQKIHKTFIFSRKIVHYYIEDYPKGYDPDHLPHENTLKAAKKYCMKYKCSGITYTNDQYEVRNGKYINYFNDLKLLSWILL